MCDSKTNKLDSVYKLLTKFNFQPVCEIPNGLKCIKCQKLLNFAHQIPCGCRFCRHCIDDIISSGDDKCPGDTNDCKDESITTAVPDHRTNKDVSILVVQCPNETCEFECQLKDVEEHLNLCAKTNTTTGSLEIENNTDNMIVTEIMDNLRNDLKAIKQNSELKDKKIELMANEIQQIKLEKRELENLLETLKRDLDEKFDHCVGEINTRCTNSKVELLEEDFNLTKVEKSEKDQETILSQQIMVQNMMELSEQTVKQCSDNLQREVSRINDENSKCLIELSIRLEELENWKRRYHTIFIWRIDHLPCQHGEISSDVFYGAINKYKMQLTLLHSFGQELCANLIVSSCDKYACVQWPFQAEVAIKIANKSNVNMAKVVTKVCKIDPPINEQSQRSEIYSFSLTQLIKDGIIQNNCCIIECIINQL